MVELFTKTIFYIRKRMRTPRGERGVVFIMALVISATLIAISLALTTIMTGELRISAGAGYYIPAFYAADTGVEQALYCQRNGLSCAQTSGTLTNNASYTYEIDNPGVDGCTGAANLCIFSTGTLQGLSRRIQVSY